MQLSKEMLTSEQATNVLNLVHDEYLECVIAGYEEDYQSWAEFAANCIKQIIVPRPRPAA